MDDVALQTPSRRSGAVLNPVQSKHPKGSPLWWRDQLGAHLEARRPSIERFDEYYRGEHNLRFSTAKWKEAFGDVLSDVNDNWCELVADAAEERLNVTGFRFGEHAPADRDAWRIWQANALDGQSQLAHNEALVTSTAYGITWFNPDDDETPLITVEHASEVIVAHAAGNRRLRRAALKQFVDDDGYPCATVHLPDKVYRYRRRRRTDVGLWLPGWADSEDWEPNTFDGEPEEPNPLKVVAVVPLPNRPRMLKEGVSELANVIPLQDVANKLLSDLIVASEYGAYPQRYAIGVQPPRKSDDNSPSAEFLASQARLWLATGTPGGGVQPQFGQFDATDLGNYVKAIELVVQHIASQTRTPPHYFYLSGQFPSGESIKSAETGLVAKVKRKQYPFGEGWEELMRLAFLVKGDERRARINTAETIWGDPESRTESEHVDAVVKKSQFLPWRQVVEDLGYSPTQIERMEEMRRQEAIEQSAAAADFQALLNAPDRAIARQSTDPDARQTRDPADELVEA